MDWSTAKSKLLANQQVRIEYERVDLSYEIGRMVSELRIQRGLTQGKLAELVGTKQPSIARLEKGAYLPSLSFLQKVAKAFNTELLPPNFKQNSAEAKPSTVSFYEVIKVRPDIRQAHSTSWGASNSDSFNFDNIAKGDAVYAYN